MPARGLSISAMRKNATDTTNGKTVSRRAPFDVRHSRLIRRSRWQEQSSESTPQPEYGSTMRPVYNPVCSTRHSSPKPRGRQVESAAPGLHPGQPTTFRSAVLPSRCLSGRADVDHGSYKTANADRDTAPATLELSQRPLQAANQPGHTLYRSHLPLLLHNFSADHTGSRPSKS